MKYLFWFLLPLCGLIVVIQTMVITPLSGSANRRGAAISKSEGTDMPLYAASRKKTITPIQQTVQTSGLSGVEGEEQELARLQESFNRIFTDVREITKKSDKSVVSAEVKAPSTFDAIVSKVYDGDTISVDVRGTITKVRLAAIDAPELKQEDGEEVKERLASLILNKQVKVEPVDTDRYGRVVAFITIGDTEINRMLVKEGWVWFYKAYAYGRDYYEVMTWAMGQKVGVWRNQGVLPPALFRKLATLGQLGKNIIKNGLWKDSRGRLHNKNMDCLYKYPSCMRWNGIDSFENCPVCYGAIFSPSGVLGEYVNDASSEAYVEDNWEEEDVTDLQLETHLADDEMFDVEPIITQKAIKSKQNNGSNCPSCNTGFRWFGW